MSSNLTELTPKADDTKAQELNPSDIQRTALRDLVKLGAQCAQTETQIEHWYETSVKKSHEEFVRVSRELEDRQTAARQQIEQQYSDALRQLHEQYQSAVGSVRDAERSAKTQLEQGKADVDREIKQKF